MDSTGIKLAVWLVATLTLLGVFVLWVLQLYGVYLLATLGHPWIAFIVLLAVLPTISFK